MAMVRQAPVVNMSMSTAISPSEQEPRVKLPALSSSGDVLRSQTNSAVQRVLRNLNRNALESERSEANVTEAHMRNMTSSLFRAVVDGRLSRVRFLIGTAGVRSDARNDLGQNVLVASLHIKDADRRRKIFNFLLERCAVDCDAADVTTGRDIVTWAAILNRPDQVRQTLDWSAGDVDLFHADYNGLTAMHYAAAAGHVEVVQMLALALSRYRHSVDLPDSKFQRLTPYLYARHNGHADVANVLVQAGASRYQFDTSVFMSGDDWEKLGRRQLRQQRPQKRSSPPPPSGVNLTSSKSNLIPVASSAAVTMPNSDTKTNFNDTGDVSSRDRRNHRSPPTRTTLNALFALDGASAGGTTVDHFVSSVREPDPGCPDERRPTDRRLPALTTLMDMLSVQQSSSYRSPRAAPPRRRARPVVRRRRSMAKKKTSSLALTMNYAERKSTKASKHAPQA